ncbi:MAG: ketopantoate reductase family protein [Pseudomonadales bacterium]
MRYVIYGAGGVGGTIGARLQLAGAEVVFIARGEHGKALQDQGLRFVSAEGVQQLAVQAVLHPRELTFTAADVVLLCMKSQHTAAALADLGAAIGPELRSQLAVVCAQNGVANEPLALRTFRNVYGMLVQLPATHLRPGEVITSAAHAGGVLDTGRYPSGVDACAQALCVDLARAGFVAEPDAAVMAKKYAKLLTNLGNGPQALLPREVLQSEAGQLLLRSLKHEALACFAAAGIECASKDTVAQQVAKIGYHDVPGYPRQGGSSWQSLQRGTGDIELDYLNGEVVHLGRLHGVPTPANEACQQLGVALAAAGGAPGSVSLTAIQQRIAALATAPVALAE